MTIPDWDFCMLLAALSLAVLAASPDEGRQAACAQTFKTLVGDTKDTSFGRSIGGRVQALNAGLRDMGLQKRSSEAWADEVAPLVAILRKNRVAFITSCKSELKRIVEPCEPYGYGSDAFRMCVDDRRPEFNCFADRGPWQFFSSLKAGTLSEGQTTLVDFMLEAANARPYCAE